jgi:hypothetical protein
LDSLDSNSEEEGFGKFKNNRKVKEKIPEKMGPPI